MFFHSLGSRYGKFSAPLNGFLVSTRSSLNDQVLSVDCKYMTFSRTSMLEIRLSYIISKLVLAMSLSRRCGCDLY